MSRRSLRKAVTAATLLMIPLLMLVDFWPQGLGVVAPVVGALGAVVMVVHVLEQEGAKFRSLRQDMPGYPAVPPGPMPRTLGPLEPARPAGGSRPDLRRLGDGILAALYVILVLFANARAVDLSVPVDGDGDWGLVGVVFLPLAYGYASSRAFSQGPPGRLSAQAWHERVIISRRLSYLAMACLGPVAVSGWWRCTPVVSGYFLTYGALGAAAALGIQAWVLALSPEAIPRGPLRALCLGALVLAPPFVYHMAGLEAWLAIPCWKGILQGPFLIWLEAVALMLGPLWMPPSGPTLLMLAPLALVAGGMVQGCAPLTWGVVPGLLGALGGLAAGLLQALAAGVWRAGNPRPC